MTEHNPALTEDTEGKLTKSSDQMVAALSNSHKSNKR